MARKKYSIDSRIDYSVILPVFFLLLIGLVAIYIATINDYPSTIASDDTTSDLDTFRVRCGVRCHAV